MTTRPGLLVIGVDVGGTNTDAVLLRSQDVLAWHKVPTTTDIQTGVASAIQEVTQKGAVPPTSISSVHIGTTQFVNAVLEEDGNKLDKVAVVRLCGPYSQGTPPFAGFSPRLRRLMEGHVSLLDGGYQVDGSLIASLSRSQLEAEAAIIKSKSITSIVVSGIYSPSNPSQEEEAASIISAHLGPGYDITCSHKVGRLGFLERENASIINASLRRFARDVVAGFVAAVQVLGKCPLYITLNDGTLSRARDAAEYPVRCFSSGPTNSARGAAILSAEYLEQAEQENKEVLVVDIGGTTTDICALLPSGFPRQSAAFVKFSGVRINSTVPDVHSLPLGGGSRVRGHGQSGVRVTIGPDSVGYRLQQEGIYFGGHIMTATDLALKNTLTEKIDPAIVSGGISEINRILEGEIDRAKTKQGDALVILVGGGSIIVSDTLAGAGQLIRPRYFEVANAIGAAVGKISGMVDTVCAPGNMSIEQHLDQAKELATERCITAGGDPKDVEVVEVDLVPMSYVTNGATRIMVRVVSNLVQCQDNFDTKWEDSLRPELCNLGRFKETVDKASGYIITKTMDVESYRPTLEEDLWYVSPTDLDFLQDGSGVLGVGSCGEPYPTYLACMELLMRGNFITIRRQDSIRDSDLVLICGFMGSPSVYEERIPGLEEVTSAIHALVRATGVDTFDAFIPNEIGGLNAFEALLAAARLQKTVLDADCVARAYPYLWQTVRCLQDVPVAPVAIADGQGRSKILHTARDDKDAEEIMRRACIELGSLSGITTNPIPGGEARTLPKNSFSYAWSIGRSIALARQQKRDVASALVREHNGVLLGMGKITSVTRTVGEGFTKGNVVVSPDLVSNSSSESSLLVLFENENLSVTAKSPGREEKVLAICPDLITLLDKANGAPLGVSDYRYGVKVSVIALRSPPVWTSEKGLSMGGPAAFGLDIPYRPVGEAEYQAPMSVWDMFS